MTRGQEDRSAIASSFTVVKGALVEETYAVLAGWDLSRSKKQNLDALKSRNSIGASSAKWLLNVAKVMNRRLDPSGRDLPLLILAKGGCSLEEWKPLLLWHITRDEFLLRDFLQYWLFPAYDSGVFRVRPVELHGYLRQIRSRGGVTEHPWKDSTVERVAVGLFKAAAAFGLLRGVVGREFAPYHLPERSFLYILHAMRDNRINPSRIVSSPEWRIFLMRPSDVESELLRLHQFRRLEYQAAGSLVELSLPCGSLRQYAEEMVA